MHTHMEVEAELTRLWSSVLGLEAISPDDTFLALGGDSMADMQCANQIARRFSVRMPPRNLLSPEMTIRTPAAAIHSVLSQLEHEYGVIMDEVFVAKGHSISSMAPRMTAVVAGS